MTRGRSGYDSVRAELAARIGLIDARMPAGDPSGLAREIDAIRSIACRSGMHPAVTVAQALKSALASGVRGPLIQSWLAVLSDAVDSEETDAAACSTYAAACCVRLTG